MISIIMPVFNGERYVAEAIESVLNQTRADWELLIVDDGSTDGTARVVSAYVTKDDRISMIRQRNSGVASARNRGAAETSDNSEFYLFLDSDDILVPTALQRLVTSISTNASVVATHGLSMALSMNPRQAYNTGMVLGFRWRMNGLRLHMLQPHEPTTLDVMLMGCSIATPGVTLIRRRCFEQAAGFDPTMVPAEDWDFWIRLCRMGQMAFVPEVVLHYRLHSSNSSRNTATMKRALKRVRRKTGNTSSWRERRMTILGKLVGRPQVRLGWAEENMRDGEWLEAIRNCWRAGKDVFYP